MQSLYAELCPAGPGVTLDPTRNGTTTTIPATWCARATMPARRSSATTRRPTPTVWRACPATATATAEHRAARADRAALGRTQQPDRAGPVAGRQAYEQVWMSYDFTNTLAQRVMEAFGRAPLLRQTQLTLGSYVLRQTTDLATGVTGSASSLRITNSAGALVVASDAGGASSLPARRQAGLGQRGTGRRRRPGQLRSVLPLWRHRHHRRTGPAQVAAKAPLFKQAVRRQHRLLLLRRALLTWSWGRWLNPIRPAGRRRQPDGVRQRQPAQLHDPDGHGKTDPSKQASRRTGASITSRRWCMLKTYMPPSPMRPGTPTSKRPGS